MLVTYFQLVQTFFGEDLYLNALNEERVVRKTKCVYCHVIIFLVI